MVQHIPPIPEIIFSPLADWKESLPVCLVSTRAAWQAVRSKFQLEIASEIEVVTADLVDWKALLPKSKGEVIYAVGGGLAADAAKWIAHRQDKPLVCIPTALSVDAFLTWASGVRQDGCVRYIPTKPPGRLIIDFAVIAAAPPAIRSAGICDVLSIATGCWDWQYAHACKMNPPDMIYDPAVAGMAQAILSAAFDCAQAAGRGDPGGLKALLDCLVMEVVLCNQIGHSRPEEGSEHYFAYAVENELGKGLPHGDLVGPGIMLMAEFQGQETVRMEAALRACRIPLDTIPPSVTQRVLTSLPAYVRQHNLPYGIAHTLK
jgi:glycerol-1-phosphate dehydrogenase [NAD(P)+]